MCVFFPSSLSRSHFQLTRLEVPSWTDIGVFDSLSDFLVLYLEEDEFLKLVVGLSLSSS